MSGRYLRYSHTNTILEYFSEAYPFCTLIPLDLKSQEDRTSWVLRVKAGSQEPRHGILLIAGVHAREWGSTDILIFFLESILEAYDNSTDIILGEKSFSANTIKNMLESIDLFIFPIVNPDGKEYSQTGNIRWRKNRRDLPGTGVAYGVDNNRNYDFLWDFETHFHPDICSTYYFRRLNVEGSLVYHGESPFSEPENLNVRFLLDEYPNIRLFIDIHCATDPGKILLPWGDDEIQFTDPLMNFTNPSYDGLRGIPNARPDGALYKGFFRPTDYTRFCLLGHIMMRTISEVRQTMYSVGPGFTESNLYPVSGSSKDYVYGRHIQDSSKSKIDSFLIEWGPTSEWDLHYSFQPPYYAPPDLDLFTPVIHDVSAGLIGFCELAQRIPIIKVDPLTIDFGIVRVGYPKTVSVTFSNLGVNSVIIENTQFEDNYAPSPFTKGAFTLPTVPPAQSTNIDISFSPLNDDIVSSSLEIIFYHDNETTPMEQIKDVRVLKIEGRGCEAPKSSCTTPVFEANEWYVCLLGLIVAPAVILGFILMILIFGWTPLGSHIICSFKRYLFRLRNCSSGNSNPCIILGKS